MATRVSYSLENDFRVLLARIAKANHRSATAQLRVMINGAAAEYGFAPAGTEGQPALAISTEPTQPKLVESPQG